MEGQPRCESSQLFTSAAQIAAVFSCLLHLVVYVAPVSAQSWETVAQGDNLRVERRDYPGSALHEVRGRIRLKASLNALMALLKDAATNQQWVYRSGGARILQEEGYARAYVYGVIDAPWPMQDRDTVVRFDYRQASGGDITISITNAPDYLPQSQAYVRVPDFGGFWHLQRQQEGWVEVTYQVRGDPGGWIPEWVANYAAVTSVTRTLQAMVWAVARYNGARSEFVREVSSGDN